MNVARKLVYIAGPYSNGHSLAVRHQDANVRVAMKVQHDLMEEGFDALCPHLTHFTNELYPLPYERWMQLCLNEVSRCDAVLRIKGASKGADRECALAIDLDIPVYGSLKELIEGER